MTPEMLQSLQVVFDAALRQGGSKIYPHVKRLEEFFNQSPAPAGQKEAKPDLDRQPHKGG
jgi:hypothetical protein